MMHSMIENEKPTKSEVLDVANAIFDGATCTMLSEKQLKVNIQLNQLMRWLKFTIHQLVKNII